MNGSTALGLKVLWNALLIAFAVAAIYAMLWVIMDL